MMGRQHSQSHRVLQGSVWCNLVSKVHKLLLCKWITQSLLENGTDDWKEHSQNPILSPIIATELHFKILKPRACNYNWLSMTSSFRLGLQVQMWFLFLGGLRKLLALTPLLLHFWVTSSISCLAGSQLHAFSGCSSVCCL